MRRDQVYRATAGLSNRRVADFRPRDSRKDPIGSLETILADDYELAPASVQELAPGRAPGHNAEASTAGSLAIKGKHTDKVRVGNDGRLVYVVVPKGHALLDRFPNPSIRVKMVGESPVIVMAHGDPSSGPHWGDYGKQKQHKRIRFHVSTLRLGKRFPMWTLSPVDSAEEKTPGMAELVMPSLRSMRPPHLRGERRRLLRSEKPAKAPQQHATTTPEVQAEIDAAAEQILAPRPENRTIVAMDLATAIETINEHKRTMGEDMELFVTEAGSLEFNLARLREDLETGPGPMKAREFTTSYSKTKVGSVLSAGK